MRVGRERRSARKRRAQVSKRRRIVVFLAVVVAVPRVIAWIIAGVLMLGLRTVAAVQQDLPSLAAQGDVTLAQTTQIYASDGTLLAYLHGEQNRTVISGKDIPDVMRLALVSVEDERFYSHTGVDLEGFVRALVADVQSQKITQGFSTITMQLVGNLYLDRTDISFARKFDEMALAWQMEQKYSKNEILDMYLNTVYFGSNAYGVEAAARTYFDKDPADLTLPEAALLAGLPQAPSAYSPRQHPEAALTRRNSVLNKMNELGFITNEELQAALNTPIKLAPYSPYTQVQEPYVVAYVRKQLIDMFGQDEVFNGGLRVQTTINPAYQQLAADAITSTLNEKDDPSAAMVCIQPSTGYILAMIGGSDYDSSKFNLAAQGRRQPGSAFKTFCLAAAIEAGMDPWNTYYVSQPLSIPIPGSTKPWDVTTYSHTYLGTVSVARATLASDNTVYAQMAMDVGAAHIVDVAHRMGITSYLNADPAIALGGLTYGVSPLEMASAYATLANGGVHIEPTIIKEVTDSTGKVLYKANPKKTQAISPGVAYEVTRILQMNIQSGTGTKAQIKRPEAGKTGTASNWCDAWFCGYTPNLSTAVWMGNADAQVPMTNVHGIRVTGGSFPAQMWQKFMNVADRNYDEQPFAVPTVTVRYDPFFQSSFQVTPSSSSTVSLTSSTSTSEFTPSSDGLPPDITAPPTPTTNVPSTSF
jgi:1A family penicillin-binding protein